MPPPEQGLRRRSRRSNTAYPAALLAPSAGRAVSRGGVYCERRIPMSPSRPRALVALVSIVTFAVGCAGPSAQGGPKLWRESSDAVVAPELARVNDLLADLAARLQPGLVHVRVQRATPPKDDSSREDPAEPRRSTGSGFVIDPSGLIVTNAHVIEGAAAVQVRLADGQRFPAKVVGRDNRVDLALLRIDGAQRL